MKRFLFGLCLFFFVAASWGVGAWDKIDYRRLMETKKCVKCDVTKASLSGADLVFTNLSGANLSGADLNEVNLSTADLEGANLTETKMCETKMPNGTRAGSISPVITPVEPS